MEPVETVAAESPVTETIRPSNETAKSYVTEKPKVAKTVTGRTTVTPLKTKHLLKIVENPSRDGKAKPSRDVKAQKVPGRTAKPDEPSRDELDAFKRLLPVLQAGRWTVENEGYGWKVRRVWDHDGTTTSKRFFGIRWTTWRKLKGVYDDDRIRTILAEKVRDKERRLADADARSLRRSNAG